MILGELLVVIPKFNKILHYMSHVTLQIVKHVKGHEINEANRAIYLTASESQALVRLC